MAYIIPGYTASVGYGDQQQVICGILQLEGIAETEHVTHIAAAQLADHRLTLHTNAGDFAFEGLHDEVVQTLRQQYPLVVQDLQRGFEQQLPVQCT